MTERTSVTPAPGCPPTHVADVMAIQNLQATYMQRLGAGTFDSILDLFDLDDPQVEMSYGGNPPKVGVEGLKAEWAQLTQLFNVNGGVLGAHMLTTPMIAVDPDGLTAKGAWITYGFTFMGAGFGRDKRQAMPSMSAYSNRFRKVNGVWLISRLSWDVIATLEAAQLDPQWGWVRSPIEAPFPYGKHS